MARRSCGLQRSTRVMKMFLVLPLLVGAVSGAALRKQRGLRVRNEEGPEEGDNDEQEKKEGGCTMEYKEKKVKFHDCTLAEIQIKVAEHLKELKTIKINEDGTVKAEVSFSRCKKNAPKHSPDNRPDPSCEATTTIEDNQGLKDLIKFRDLVGIQEACLMGISSPPYKEVTQESVNALSPKTNTWNTLAEARATSLKHAQLGNEHNVWSVTTGRISKLINTKKEKPGVKLNLVSILNLQVFASPPSRENAQKLCAELQDDRKLTENGQKNKHYSGSP